MDLSIHKTVVYQSRDAGKLSSDALGSYIVSYAPRKVPHRAGPLDADGIPMFDPMQMRIRYQPVYHPTVVIQYGLAHYELFCAGSDEALAVFLKCADWLCEHVEDRGRFLAWPYPMPLRTPRLAPPFYSGMGQGQALSLLCRAWQHAPSDSLRQVIEGAAASFRYTIDDGGVITRSPSGRTFIQEIAHRPAITVLNGCLYALFGLNEYARLFADANAACTVESTIAGVEELLPQFNIGTWSRYAIGLRFKIANLYYHSVHVQQLRHLGSLFNNERFSNYARRWGSALERRSDCRRAQTREFFHLQTNRVLTLTGFERFKYRDPYAGVR